MEIEFNGFKKHAIEQYPKEACAFLYSYKPYDSEEKWIIQIVKNVSEEPEHNWMPDKKDVARLKRWADKMNYVKIGNLHTHPLPLSVNSDSISQLIQDGLYPSETDLKFARRFNDIVRGIIVVDKDKIFDIVFHDKFGMRVDIKIEEKEQEAKNK